MQHSLGHIYASSVDNMLQPVQNILDKYSYDVQVFRLLNQLPSWVVLFCEKKKWLKNILMLNLVAQPRYYTQDDDDEWNIVE